MVCSKKVLALFLLGATPALSVSSVIAWSYSGPNCQGEVMSKYQQVFSCFGATVNSWSGYYRQTCSAEGIITNYYSDEGCTSKDSNTPAAELRSLECAPTNSGNTSERFTCPTPGSSSMTIQHFNSTGCAASDKKADPMTFNPELGCSPSSTWNHIDNSYTLESHKTSKTGGKYIYETFEGNLDCSGTAKTKVEFFCDGKCHKNSETDEWYVLTCSEDVSSALALATPSAAVAAAWIFIAGLLA